MQWKWCLIVSSMKHLRGSSAAVWNLGKSAVMSSIIWMQLFWAPRKVCSFKFIERLWRYGTTTSVCVCMCVYDNRIKLNLLFKKINRRVFETSNRLRAAINKLPKIWLTVSEHEPHNYNANIALSRHRSKYACNWDLYISSHCGH